MANPDILSLRYATPDMNSIFSLEDGILRERRLWVAVMRAQQELGIDIPEETIRKYEQAIEKIDFERIKEIERETRHDVKAKIQAFNEVAGVKASEQQTHRGMTSRDLDDNVWQSKIKDASEVALGKSVSVLRHLSDKANQYREIVLTARTHGQPAQPTLLGRRFAMWGEELYGALEDFDEFISHYPLRGIKGPVGTQSDMLALLGNQNKVQALEQKVAKSLGFIGTLNATGQIYPRSLDFRLTSRLTALTGGISNFANGIRDMASRELVTEGFKEGQVGSSAMPHKMNTRSSERIWGLSQVVKAYNDLASRISGEQPGEGDVSDSVPRRVFLPGIFYAFDGLCETALTVMNEMGPYPEVISCELDRYLPFLATTQVLGLYMEKGLGREQAHALVKKHAIEAAKSLRRGEPHNFAHNLANDPSYANVSEQEIQAVLSEREQLLGNADSQVRQFRQKAIKILKSHSYWASYEPGEIL
jgi:adenylosuccinate lyase